MDSINIDFRGFKLAEVRDNIDPNNEGVVKVFIPELMSNDNFGEIPLTKEVVNMSNEHIKNEDIYEVGGLETSNYYEVRPVHFVEDNSKGWKYEHRDTNGGTYKVPRIGQKVFIMFLDEDPQKGYYLPFTPTVEGEVITPLYTESDWNGNRENIDIIGAYWNGNIIEMDTNIDNNLFSITVVDDPRNIEGPINGNFIFKMDQSENLIMMETPKETGIELNDNNISDIKIYSGKHKITLDKNGNININDRIVIDSNNNIDINGGTLNINADSTNINGKLTTGNLHVNGNITATGSNPNHHGH